ncbi:MAG: polysaccharide deacetylase family protein [Clostridia bacterium]|nr:polysaccharide deacetylase family protein [Clostridia bacterium]
MKIYCFSAKACKVYLSLILVVFFLGFLLVSTKSESVYLGYAARKVPIYAVDTDEKKVALTFDAAWGADKTSKIVEILKENQVGGTFFLVGFWSEKYADKIKEIDEAGLVIGTHSNTHPKMSGLSEAQIRDELSVSSNLITSVTGKPVRFFRPPYGDYNDTLLDTASSLGLQTIQWSVDTLDWKGLSADAILERVKKDIASGGIILMHNNSDHIVETLPKIIAYLKAEGYKMVGLDELVFAEGYDITQNGIQTKK